MEEGKEVVDEQAGVSGGFPLGLPEGSIRGLIALSVVGISGYTVAFTQYELGPMWENVFLVVISAYFGKDLISAVAARLRPNTPDNK